jgi:hypothetical protein
MADLFIALLHYPVLDKNGQIVTTALTNMDIHDIARSARTYDVTRFFVVTPVLALRALAEKIIEHWEVGFGSTYNVTRKDALSIVALESDLDGVIVAVEHETKRRPRIVVTSAKDGGTRVGFATLRHEMNVSGDPHLVVFGTGWGLAPEVVTAADYYLEPITGVAGYNHLSVRSATAIVLDRLRGAR